MANRLVHSTYIIDSAGGTIAQTDTPATGLAQGGGFVIEAACLAMNDTTGLLELCAADNTANVVIKLNYLTPNADCHGVKFKALKVKTCNAGTGYLYLS